MDINDPVLHSLLGDDTLSPSPLPASRSQTEPDRFEAMPEDVKQQLTTLGVRELWGKDNFKRPAYAPKKERFEHRIIAYIKATQPGLTNREIGERVGLHEVTIAYLLRQPYMELAVLEEVKKSYDPAMQLLQNEAFDAASRLIQISKDAENDEVRRKANNDVLDRKYGKPNQPMSVQKKDASSLSDQELADIIAKSEAKAN
jgi:hypothetical protein